MFDCQKIWMLLEIIHKAATAGPAYAWIGVWAASELHSMKPPPVIVAPPPPTGPMPVPVGGLKLESEEDQHG